MVLVDDRANLDTVDDLPQHARDGALRALTGVYNGHFQVPLTHACDRFGFSTIVEEL